MRDITGLSIGQVEGQYKIHISPAECQGYRLARQRKLGMAIGVTYLEQGELGVYNSEALIDRAGALVLNYAKVHTCAFSFEAVLMPGAGMFSAIRTPPEHSRGGSPARRTDTSGNRPHVSAGSGTEWRRHLWIRGWRYSSILAAGRFGRAGPASHRRLYRRFAGYAMVNARR